MSSSHENGQLARVGEQRRAGAFGSVGRWLRQAAADVFSIDLRSLALFRIALGLLILADLALRSRDIATLYSDGGLWPRTVAIIDGVAAGWKWTPFFWSGSPHAAVALFVVTALAAIALAAGWRTRLATAICWLLMCSLHSRNALVLSGGDFLLRLLLFWSLFLPLGARWSLDARSRGTSAGKALSGATAALLLQVCLVYWFNAAHKSGPAWVRDFTALEQSFLVESYATPLADAMLPYRNVLKALTWAAWWLEVLGPVVALSPFANGRCRLVAAAAFIGFHLLGILPTLRLGIFPWISAVSWLPFLPALFWRKVAPYTEPAVAEEVVRAPVPVSAMALVLMGYITLINIRTLSTPPYGQPLPFPWNMPGKVLRIEQRWGLFAPGPPTKQGWFVIVGTVRDGSRVNLLEGPDETVWDRPVRLGAQLPNSRWRVFLAQTRSPRKRDRLRAVAGYYVRRWNGRHPESHRVSASAIYFRLETFWPTRSADYETYLLYDESAQDREQEPPALDAADEPGNEAR